MSADLSGIADTFRTFGARLGLGLGMTGLGPIFGISVHEQWQIDRGRPVLTGSDVYGHPLDINMIRHHRDPHAQLDGSRDLLVARAHAKLDAMEAVLNDMGWEDRQIIAGREW
jgi:hypothetical protein